MALIVPSYHKEPLSSLAGLEPVRRHKVVEALQEVAPNSSLREVTGRLSEAANLSLREAERVAGLLLSLSTLPSRLGIEKSDLAKQITDAMEAEGDRALVPHSEDWAGFAKDLDKILTLPGLAVLAKSAFLREDHPTTFCQVKILTDLRPVFGDDVIAPVAALIQHTLRLSYHEQSETKDIFVRLDRAHLERLREVVDRALLKGEALLRLAGKAEVPVLEEEA